MAEGKWITGLTPEMPAAEAARVVLAVRLSAVQHYLPLAAEHAAEDVEHVHQLRVATRRAGAAVRIFRDFLPRKTRRGARRALRSVRRAAGDARDWDVFLNRLATSGVFRTAARKPAADFLAGYALGFRAAAQDDLITASEKHSSTVLDLCSDLPAAVRPPRGADTEPTLADLGREVLGELFGRFAAGVDSGPTAPAELHRLRITAKRLRYAVEVFAGCYSPPLREVLYPAVEEVQEILGRIQDAAVAAGRLEMFGAGLRYVPVKIARRVQPGIAALAEDVRSRAEADERAFRDWLGRWRAVAVASQLLLVTSSA
jgi:CHAD domain-containing protein